LDGFGMSTPASSYLDDLPAVYRTDDFIGRFLLAFEALFTGLPDVQQPGLEQTIDGVGRYFDPLDTPSEFLPWLASWVALTLRADWDDDTARGFIREVVPLYRLRGTAAGLKRILEIYLRPLGDQVTRDDVVVFDDFAAPDHFFQVRLTLSDNNPARLRATQEMARAIIDIQKPAHTVYALKVVIPTMRLVSLDLRKSEGGQTPLLILGDNTWLGTAG
jgi:phage tail-like protein